MLNREHAWDVKNEAFKGYEVRTYLEFEFSHPWDFDTVQISSG